MNISWQDIMGKRTMGMGPVLEKNNLVDIIQVENKIRVVIRQILDHHVVVDVQFVPIDVGELGRRRYNVYW